MTQAEQDALLQRDDAKESYRHGREDEAGEPLDWGWLEAAGRRFRCHLLRPAAYALGRHHERQERGF